MQAKFGSTIHARNAIVNFVRPTCPINTIHNPAKLSDKIVDYQRVTGNRVMSYRIIAFDGGGIRGLVSALLLRNLESRANLLDRTDMFAGTSAGSILALGLAQDTSVEQIVTLFKTKGAAIFDTAMPDKNGAGAAADGEGVNSAYQPDNLKAELVKLFGPGQLCELPLSGAQVMVNALHLSPASGGQWAPVAIGSGRSDPFRAMSLVDAAMGSAATPTYFPPHMPEYPANKDWGHFADGGLFANNPSASAIAYAAQHFQVELAEVKVLSIGTGMARSDAMPQGTGGPDRMGAWQWFNPVSQQGDAISAAPLIDAALSASAAACGHYAEQMIGGRFLRADAAIGAAYELDDWQNIDVLEEAAARVLATAQWDELADKVAEYWDAPDDLAIPAKAALSRSNRPWFSTLFRA